MKTSGPVNMIGVSIGRGVADQEFAHSPDPGSKEPSGFQRVMERFFRIFI